MRDLTDFCQGPGVLRLHGGVQHYAWGSTDLIPGLIGEPNADGKPYAELWLGAHPELPSKVELGSGTVGLDRLVAACPGRVLGEAAARRYGELPYLFKVLSAAVPLSIQAHPTRAQAEEGFAREEACGIPLSAPHRNYKDTNHKPEALVALTEFFALRGFRPLAEIAALPAEVPEFAPLFTEFEPTSAGLQSLYRRLMTSGQGVVDAALAPLLERLRREAPSDPRERGYWTLEADRQFSRDGHHDRGLFSLWLLNLVRLAPGEGIYLPAGNLHAYLRGTGMELMANSNNVLRGGLTPKHVDVDELLDVVTFEGGEAEVIRGERDGVEAVYRTPAEEFELRRIDLPSGGEWHGGRAHGADILIVTAADADLTLESGGRLLGLARGESLFAPAGVSYSLRTGAPATVFRATAPDGR
ncbi:mannose-6-phosphate isomerase, class I [Lentisalinibacter sediminis]|uniref:mannose-6-phosphate isomerase, class I n=1 Tax=Lentisalinibacter sediminis TaxID=2992237 RepID=UPI00387066FB